MKGKSTPKRDRIVQLIEQRTGETAKVLAVPTELIHFLGSVPKALFLAQLLYWSDRATRADGFIYKSRRQWREETGLSSNQVERFTKEFKEDKKFLDTKILKANGSPTIHYKLNLSELEKSFSRYFESRLPENLAMKSQESDNSLTENTTKNTEDILSLLSKQEDDNSQPDPYDMEKNSVEAVSSESEQAYSISATFNPSVEQLFQATLTFPTKSPSYVTQKFIRHFQGRGIRHTKESWEKEWWNWMNSECPSHANTRLEKEVSEITRQVEKEVLYVIQGMELWVFDEQDVVDQGKGQFTYSTVEAVLGNFVTRGVFAEIEGYYYDLIAYQGDLFTRQGIDDALTAMGLPTAADSF